MRKSLTILTLLTAAAWCSGQTVEVPKELHTDPGVPLPVTAKADGANVIWLCPDKGLTVIDGGFFGGDSKRAMVFGSAPGVYRLWVITAKGDKVSSPGECLVTVGTPGPPPPQPPPGPGPVPPPGPGPIPPGGMKVLVVYETADASKYSLGQQTVLYGKSVRDYLNSHTPLGPDGKTHEWRIYDKDVDTHAEAQVWQDLMKRPRQSTPWLIIAGPDGKPVAEQELPKTADDALKVLKKYGGE